MATEVPQKWKPRTLALAISLLKTDPDAALIPEERDIDSIVENGQLFSPNDVKQSENGNEGLSIAELEEKSFRVRVPHWLKLHCKELGKGPPEASCQPEDGATIEISPANTEYTYQCQIVPKKVGQYTLSFKHEGEHIPGSPVHVKFSPRGDAFKCHLVETTSECEQETAPVNNDEQQGGSDLNTPRDMLLFCVSTKGAGMGVLTASVKSSSTKKFVPTTITQCGEDHFHVEFLSSKGTEYIMGLKYDQQHIHGSPFRVIVSDASQCHSEGEGLSVARLNKQNKFSVYTKNAGPGELSAAVKGEGGSLETTITAITETHHEVAYCPGNMGKYTISLLWGGEDIPGSPFTVQCYKPDSEKCAVTRVEVPQDSRKPATIHVDASRASNWQLEAQAVGDKTGPANVEVKEEGDKKFLIFLQSSASDYYNVSITWGGEPIPESPLRLNLHHPNSKEVVVAEPPNASLQTGQAIKICFGTSTAGRGTLTAKCKCKGVSIPVDVAQRETDRNLYDVQFTPPDADVYHLKVKWAGKPVKGSPFVIDLRPVFAHNVKVTGPNMPKGIKGPVEMGISTENAGNAQVTAKCIGSKAGQVPLNLKKISEHKYKLSFNPPKPDIYTLSVKYGGQHILHSPFYINTMPADPSKVKVIVPNTLELSQLLHYKCDVLQAGTGSLTATCQGEKPGEAAIKVSIVREGPTKYDISFTLEQAGIYYLSIQWTDKEVPGSPFVLNLTPQADKVKVGELHIPKIAGTDEPVWVELDCSEARYGVVKGEAIGNMPDALPSEVLVEDKGDDLYRVKFQPKNPDMYSFSVHYGDQHVQGSPFSIDLISPQPNHVKHTGTAIPEEANDPVELSFDTSNAGKGDLTANTTGQSSTQVQTDVVEISPNQYKVSFTPPYPDIYHAHVFWANEKISGSPFRINTIPPDANNVHVTEPEGYELLQLVHYKVDASEAGNGELTAFCRGDRYGDVAAVPLNITEEGIAQHDLSFTPHHPDIYKLSIQWSEKEVPGSPFKLNLLPAEADKVKVTDFFIPDEAGTGEPVWVDLDYSNAGHGVLISEAKGTLAGKVSVKLEKLGSYKHKVKFQPEEPDLYSLSIYYGDSHIPGSPFSINLMLPHPDLVEHTGTTVPKKHGNPVELSFDTSEAGNGELTAQITDQSLDSVRTIVAEVSPNQYKVSFTPLHPDIYQVHVFWADEEIRGSPFRINLLPPDVNKVKVMEPESYELLQPVHYKVDAFNAGNGNLAAICKGEDIALVHLNMVEEDIGQYDLSFTPRHPDFYTLSIEWSGREVHGSPFKVNLLPPEADKVQVLDMHIPDMAGTGEPVRVDLDCSDAGHGVLRAEAKGKLSRSTAAEIEKLGYAEYQVRFQPHQPDMYSLSIYYSKTHIPGSPFSINLMLPQPDLVKHTGTTLSKEQEDPVTLSFDTSNAGRGKLTAQISGQLADSVDTDIIKTSPSHFKVSFIPPHLNIYQAHVFWANEEVSGSPFRINLLPPDVSKVKVTEPESYELLQPVHFKVDAFNAGNGKLTANCKGEDIALVHLNMVEEDIGQYDLSFTAHHPDLYKLYIQWSGRHVSGSPFKVNLLPAEADNVQVLDMHIPDMAGTGEPVRVDLDCSDAGHGVLRAEATGNLTHSITAEVDKLENEEYHVNFLLDQPDIYSLSIYYSDSHIPGSPFSVNLMLPQPDLVEHTGTTLPQEQEDPVTLFFDTSNAGRGKLTAQISGQLADSVDTDIIKTSPSHFKVSFIPPHLNIYQAHVFWANEEVSGSPFRINLLPPDVSKVKVTEPESYELLQPVHYKVDAFDAGNGKLTASCKGEDIALVHLNMVEEDIGQYDLSFTPNHPDLYKLYIQWSGRHVSGSPFKVNLLPAEADKVRVLDMHIPDMAGTGVPVRVDLDCSDAGHGVLRAEATGNLAHSITAEVDKRENEEYHVNFQLDHPDIYSLSIYYSDSHIPRSPFSVNLMLPQPDLVEHTGTTIPKEQEDPVTLSFNTSNAGRGNLTAYVTGELAGEQPSEVEEVSPNEYEVTFVPPRPDAYQVNVYWAKKPVKTPFMIKIVDPDNVECGEPRFTVSGKPVELAVKTEMAGPGKLSARCTGEKYGETPVKITSTTSYSYNISFNPTREDVYLLSVYFEGVEVKDSPFEVDLVPRVLLTESADAQYIEQEEITFIPEDIQKLLGAPPEDAGSDHEGETDEPLELKVYVGEPISLMVSGEEGVSDATLVAFVTGEKTGPGQVKLSPNPDDMIEVYFNPDKPDHYTLEVEHNGEPIPNSPFLFHYIMPVDPSKCYIFGLENVPASPQVNVPINLGVDAQMAGDGVLKVTIEGPTSGVKRSKVAVKSEEENPHIYNISFLPVAPGIHLMHLLWANKPVPGSPVKLEVGGGGAAQSYPLGKPFVLEIKADCSLADLSSYAIHEKNNTQHQTKIEEIMKNKFKIIFEPQVPGTYAIHIALGEEEIIGCPYHVTFTALANEEACRVNIPNSKVHVGELLTLTVDVSDAGMGGLFVQSSVPPGGKGSILTVRESEHADRAYTINYIPNITGVHHLFILWGGKPIPGCPFQISVLDECDPNVKHMLKGNATNLVEVGQQIKIVASMPKSVNDDEFLVAQCTGKNSGEVEVISGKEEKSQTVCFTPSVPDDYTFEVKVKGNPIEGSPFLIKAVEKASLAADCEQPNSSTVTAGKMVNLIAHVDEVQTTSELKARTAGPIGPCRTFITSEAGGLSSIRFFPHALGSYLVHITKGDSEIPGSPLRVVADSDASKVFIVEEDRELFQASLPLKDTVSFRISTADAGPGRLDLKAIGPGEVVVQVYNNNDGTYTCKLTPTIPGRYHVGIVWNSVHIKGSPYTVNFTSERLQMISGLDLQQERFYVGVPRIFKVECMDQNKFLDITCRPPNAAKIHTTPVADSNLYECSIVPQISGNHEIAVLYNEKHILGSPFNVQFDVRGRYTSTSIDTDDGSLISIPENIKAYGSGLQDGYVGQEGNFAIDLGEADEGTLSVQVHGPKGAFKINMRRHPENEHTILVHYDPIIAGVYTVDITWCKTHIPGSPFRVNIVEQGEKKLLA